MTRRPSARLSTVRSLLAPDRRAWDRTVELSWTGPTGRERRAWWGPRQILSTGELLCRPWDAWGDMTRVDPADVLVALVDGTWAPWIDWATGTTPDALATDLAEDGRRYLAFRDGPRDPQTPRAGQLALF